MDGYRQQGRQEKPLNASYMTTARLETNNLSDPALLKEKKYGKQRKKNYLPNNVPPLKETNLAT